MVEQHGKRGGDDEEPGNAAVLDRIEHPHWIELRQHDAGQPRRQRDNAKSGAADVRARHGNQHRLVLVPQRVRRRVFQPRLAQPEQVAVGQHCALGIPGGAAGVELEHRLVGAGRGERRARRADYVGLGFGHGETAQQPGALAQRFSAGLEPFAEEQQLGFGIIDNERRFWLGQPPADRDHHNSRARRAEEQGEIGRAVLAEPGDPVALVEAQREQGRSDPRGGIFELAVGQL